jgi:hypothetical protein
MSQAHVLGQGPSADGDRSIPKEVTVSYLEGRPLRKLLGWAAAYSVLLPLTLASSRARADMIVVNFDNVVAAPAGTLFPGNTFGANGVTFTSGSIPNTVNVGDTISFSNPVNQMLVLGNPDCISPPNFAAAADVFGVNNDILMSFSTPVTSVQLTSDDHPFESPDIIRLLALAPTANPNQFVVLALAEGLDNATMPPDNLLSVSFGGLPFSSALFQVTTEAEGFDDLTFVTVGSTAVPEPSSLLLCLVGVGGALLIGCSRWTEPAVAAGRGAIAAFRGTLSSRGHGG